MAIPTEFSAAAVAAAAAAGDTLFGEFLESGEPYRSLLEHNPWLRAPRPKDSLEWGNGWYYDTTVARRHPYWQNQDLPAPSKRLDVLRRDFLRWGYCLIEDGVSASQCRRLRERVAEQAEAERALGIAHLSPAQQHVWALINKGEQFVACMEHDPHAVQAGPLIEQLLGESLSNAWNHFSFIANISFPDCHPQGLHQDQGFLAPLHTLAAPMLVNTIYILQDVDEHNGGTLLIPGSHRAQTPDGRFGELPPAINLEAPGGTILMMDGRVLHGGAVNRSRKLRYIITNSTVKPWIKQQESFLLTISPEVLAAASPRLLMRLGLQATAVRNMVEGYGYSGNGRTGDPNGSLVHVRRAMDEGRYRHLGPLTPADVPGIAADRFTLGQIQQRFETHRNESYHRLLERCREYE
ncbi:MAG: phytanoyl-CoA dioxygenase family protein [Pseudomonadales bacterium]